MNKKYKEVMEAVGIGIVQTIAAVLAERFLQNKWIIVAFVATNVAAVFAIYCLFRKKIKEQDYILRLYRDVGIDGCTEELQGTRFEPLQCMKDVKKYLDFMGVGGNKWVDQDDKLELLENMLERVKASNGKVRYLLINPKSESYQTLKRLRQNRVPSSSYEKFKKLMEKYQCLEVRLYDDLPSFRLQFVDQEYVTVSRYYFEHELHAEKNFGWKIPHLIVRAEKVGNIQEGQIEYQGTLYKSFEQLYQYIWAHSADIKSVFPDD